MRVGHETTPINSLAVKAEGALLASAAGDALGWPQEIRSSWKGERPIGTVHVEFREWTRRSGGRYQRYEERVGAGEYSDDTQLTLAVARCRTSHRLTWWNAFTRMELPFWTLYERGAGGATKRAASSWLCGRAPWKTPKRDGVREYFRAGGNGVAMRVLPHALFLAEHRASDVLIRDVIRDGTATHGHPRALIGATAYAYAAWSLARKNDTLRFGELLDILLDGAEEWSCFPVPEPGRSSWHDASEHATEGGYRVAWDRTAHEMLELLKLARRGLQAGALAQDHAVLDSLGCFGRAKGAGTVSAAAAAYLVSRHATQPTQAVLRAAFEVGSDTDTVAAMTGGLLGCLLGIDWIPKEWYHVQDASYMKELALRVSLGSEGAKDEPPKSLRSVRSIAEELSSSENSVLDLGGGWQVAVTKLESPKPLTKSVELRAWRLETGEGQTLQVTKLSRVPSVRYNAEFKRHQRASESIRDLPVEERHPGNAGDVLYDGFLKHLRVALTSGTLGTRQVAEEMGLVPSQAKCWLDRAEQEGVIRKISSNPIRYGFGDVSYDDR